MLDAAAAWAVELLDDGAALLIADQTGDEKPSTDAAEHAPAEFLIRRLSTSIPFLGAVLDAPDFQDGQAPNVSPTDKEVRMREVSASPAEFPAAAGIQVSVSDWTTIEQDPINLSADAARASMSTRSVRPPVRSVPPSLTVI